MIVYAEPVSTNPPRKLVRLRSSGIMGSKAPSAITRRIGHGELPGAVSSTRNVITGLPPTVSTAKGPLSSRLGGIGGSRDTRSVALVQAFEDPSNPFCGPGCFPLRQRVGH